MPFGRIGGFSELEGYFKELLALAEEKSIGDKACDRSHSTSQFVAQRTNDRDRGEEGADEFARDGKDQAGLNQRIEWAEEIGK